MTGHERVVFGVFYRFCSSGGCNWTTRLDPFRINCVCGFYFVFADLASASEQLAIFQAFGVVTFADYRMALENWRKIMEWQRG